jgi:DNA-binding NarL/FixJ family response regulator
MEMTLCVLSQKENLNAQNVNGGTMNAICADIAGPRFSQREQQVAELLAKGMRQVDIAKQLCISPKTVAAHKMRVCAKMGIRSTNFLEIVLANPHVLQNYTVSQ